MTDETHRARRFARRRRENVEGGRQFRHVVKVSPEEEGRLALLAEANHITIARLLVEAALAPSSGATVTERHESIAELFALHRLLATLSNNMNQIARHANSTGEVPDELRATLVAVRRTAARIDGAIEQLGGKR